MRICCGCASTAPAARSASTSGRPGLSTPPASSLRRKQATSWRCFRMSSAESAPLPHRGRGCRPPDRSLGEASEGAHRTDQTLTLPALGLGASLSRDAREGLILNVGELGALY